MTSYTLSVMTCGNFCPFSQNQANCCVRGPPADSSELDQSKSLSITTSGSTFQPVRVRTNSIEKLASKSNPNPLAARIGGQCSAHPLPEGRLIYTSLAGCGSNRSWRNL